mmetsp:Transcript_8536/g.9673  ORF Transcript_8536/g.9673 Transcript_8536/m.9673 type:complete len:96 (+) Transcript_8536:21-308(+)
MEMEVELELGSEMELADTGEHTRDQDGQAEQKCAGPSFEEQRLLCRAKEGGPDFAWLAKGSPSRSKRCRDPSQGVPVDAKRVQLGKSELDDGSPH